MKTAALIASLPLVLVVTACGPEDSQLDAEQIGEDESSIYFGSVDSVNTAVGHTKAWTGLYDQTLCSSVLVGPRTALTAKHCIGSALQVRFTTGGFTYGGGTSYTASNTVLHPTKDLALINFASDIPGVTPYMVGAKNPLGPYPLSVELSGYGDYYDFYSSTATPLNWGRRRDFSGGTLAGDTVVVQANQGGSGCSGDSGGPVLRSVPGGKSVWGILSTFNSNCNWYGVSNYLTVTNDVTLWVNDNAASTVHFDSHQNPVQREDVNADGTVSTLDALIVINALGAGQPSTALPNTRGTFLDVSGNGTVSTQDALIVINYLSN